MLFDYFCKEKLTLDTFELYEEPIVLFTDILCNIAKSCMPKPQQNKKKRCKPWFNTECKFTMKTRKSARAMAIRACRENKRAIWQQYVSWGYGLQNQWQV